MTWESLDQSLALYVVSYSFDPLGASDILSETLCAYNDNRSRLVYYMVLYPKLDQFIPKLVEAYV